MLIESRDRLEKEARAAAAARAEEGLVSLFVAAGLLGRDEDVRSVVRSIMEAVR